MAFPSNPTDGQVYNEYQWNDIVNAWEFYIYKIKDKQHSRISGNWNIDVLGKGFEFTFPPVEESIKQYTSLSINHYDLEKHVKVLVNGNEIGRMSDNPDTGLTVEGWKHFYVDGAFVNTSSENIVRIEHDNVSADWGNIYDIEFGVNMYGRAPSQPGTSAKDILEKNPAVYGNDGLYYIGSDQIYCDMTSDGGGWTMIVSAHSNQSTITVANSRNLTITNTSGTPSNEAITSAIDTISDWSDLLIYTRGYKVKGTNVGDGVNTVRDYFNLGVPTTTSSSTGVYSAQASADSLVVLSGEVVADKSSNGYDINMGLMVRNNDASEDSRLHYGTAYAPQGFGNIRDNIEYKVDNGYGDNGLTGVTNPWENASTTEQQWFIR